jgi:RHS repeat-associated protein
MQYTWIDYAKASSAAGCDLSQYLSNGSATQNVICGDSQPLDDTTGMFVKETPCQRTYDMAVSLAQTIFEQRKQQLLADFETQYKAKCLSAKDAEQFSVQYTPKEYHYTLYYYDLAGNAVRTVPPRGARPNFNSSFIHLVDSIRGNGYSTEVVPGHLLATDYRYNSLNQVIARHTPDANTSFFWYDRIGRLVISQDSQQVHDNNYTYTVYDGLGRVTEIGQKPQTTRMTPAISQDTTALNNWLNLTGGTKEQIKATVYDVPADFLNGMLTQQNLRNRISYTYRRNFDTDVNWYTATFYTYDVHGNMDTLLQDYLGVTAMGVNDRYKRIAYTYDLISGKVNGVDYQPGRPDAFYHRYLYDAENRITEVRTSRDSIVWDRDAAYNYYKHGYLSREEIGQRRVQGLDYIYTLQGWTKGVNAGSWAYIPISGGNSSGGDSSGVTCPAGSALDDAIITSRPAVNGPAIYTARSSITFEGTFTSNDGDSFETDIDNSLAQCTINSGSGSGSTGGTGQPGGTGQSWTGEAYPVGQDVFNYTLHYYPGDYIPISGATTGSGILEALGSQGAPLYNGNIAAMAVNIGGLDSPKVYSYHYDQLNRLSAMDAYGGLNTATNTFSPIQLDDYKERITYDPNGNILTYLRHGNPGGGQPVAMDSLTYSYYPNTNQLQHIGDNPAYSGNYATDIDDQSNPNNYAYDFKGQLKSNQADSISDIEWSMYGKITSITKNGNAILYTYDADANRITKTANNVTTVYVRDAEGNVMSVYQQSGSAAPQQVEVDLYGSRRLGIVGPVTASPVSLNMSSPFLPATLYTFSRGEKLYELTNHLSNVLATVTDKKIAVRSTSDTTLIDHFMADVATAQDYYPFGMIMPGRNMASGSYRYGFNGKENDNEVKGTGNEQDYGMRMYDDRVGRFLSVDPLASSYPYYTPYQFAGNKPISSVDMDGAEDKPAVTGHEKNGDKEVTSKHVTVGSEETPLLTGLTSYWIDKVWYYYSGYKNDGHRPDWYSQQDYEDIILDWENGQVMQPYKSSWWDRLWGDDPYAPSGEIRRPGPGRNWMGWQVGEDGYLTGKRFPKTSMLAGFNLMEWTSGPGILKGRAFLKEGEFFLYYGYKDVQYMLEGEKIVEKRVYIGSTEELLKRYSQAEIKEMGITMFEFFQKNLHVRMPNRGIAIGFEQLVIRLNNDGKNIIKGETMLNKLANKINAAIKQPYIEAAEEWANKNIPNWRELFKVPPTK